MNEPVVSYDELLAEFVNFSVTDISTEVIAARAHVDAIIVLDDDPTGTQTVYDVPVLTTWEIEDIKLEFEKDTPLFYILTNSRSLDETLAIALAKEIGKNIREAVGNMSKHVMVISRSDSTLRGHYPSEVLALEEGLDILHSVHFIIPAFFEGGRYTINDIHYVKAGDHMIPAAQTPFAEDPAFGYQSSDLKEWVAEKTQGAVSSHQVKRITLDNLRNESFESLLQKVNSLQSGDICIVNAVNYHDLQKMAWAILTSDVRPLCRTAASFVAALAAQPPRPLLNKNDLGLDLSEKGALIVVGSYVPKTTQQLNQLLETGIKAIEVDVAKVIDDQRPDPSSIAQQIDTVISEGRDIVLFTSRELISRTDFINSLDIGQMVSEYLTDIISHLHQRPRYILAKGGITSSDIATIGLGVKRANVKGQVIAGVPVWELGLESKFSGIPYIIFPGNVGDHNSLREVVHLLAK